MAKVVPSPELVVAVAKVVARVGRARVLEAGRVPVLVDRVVKLAKVELAVVAVPLPEVLPVVQARREKKCVNFSQGYGIKHPTHGW